MKRYRPTLRLTIGIALSGLIILTAGLLATYSYVSTRDSLLQFSRDLIDQNARVVTEQVRGFLGPARTAAELTLALVQRKMVTAEDPESLEKYFYDFMRVHPTVSMLNYGDTRGHFVMVKRQPDESLSTKLVTRDPLRVVWRHRNPEDPVERVREEKWDPQDQYDPRTRPWYKGAVTANGLFWTGVYVFHTDRLPGVTASIPYRSEQEHLMGVLSVDIALVDVSTFLAQNIRVGTSGEAFLLDEKGQIIATRDESKLVLDDPSHPEKRRLSRLEESHRPEIAALAGIPEVAAHVREVFSGRDPGSMTLRYRVAGNDYVCTLRTIGVVQENRWLVGVLAREDEFLAAAKQANRRGLLIALFLVVIALLAGLALSRLIARGLHHLVEESGKVRNMDLASSQQMHSPFLEIDEVLGAFEAMKTGLRGFEKYVPTKLVRQLLEERQEPELGGNVRTLTILFSDIKGFTSISERLDPLELSRQLGDYLSIVTRAIQEHQGTVDKYIGDAVMAFWGAPHEPEDPAGLACQAILQSLEQLEKVSSDKPFLKDFFTRIGIHTASVVVGNFGSEDRLNYTAIGDGVNLASRLEGLNKVFGTQILVSEDTAQLVRDSFALRKLASVAVVGKKQACVVYELMGQKDKVSPERLAQAQVYEKALEMYFSANFQSAADLLREISGQDPAARWLETRCDTLREHSPGQDFDGIITMDGK